MKKVYYISIKGKTLESRNLRELLARAVAQKRNADRALMLQNLSRGQASGMNPAAVRMASGGAARI
jgi:hypothetical protein